jgi:hypothetical protein
MTMKIVNVKGMAPNAPGIVYCGRAVHGWKGSPLANPYRIGVHGDRVQCLLKYMGHLYGKVSERDPEVMAALRSLSEDSVLGCWCTPQMCHCEFIAAQWQWLHDHGMLGEDNAEPVYAPIQGMTEKGLEEVCDNFAEACNRGMVPAARYQFFYCMCSNELERRHGRQPSARDTRRRPRRVL